MKNFFTLFLAREDAYGNLEYFAKGIYTNYKAAESALGSNIGSIESFETLEECEAFQASHQ